MPAQIQRLREATARSATTALSANPASDKGLLAAAAEPGVIDRDRDRLPGRDQQRYCQAGQGEAEVTRLPAGAGEEIVRPWCGQIRDRPAPVSIPHTVRRPVQPLRPCREATPACATWPFRNNPPNPEKCGSRVLSDISKVLLITGWQPGAGPGAVEASVWLGFLSLRRRQ